MESDMRYRINHLLAEAGIVIAFPQRDIHFDSEEPVTVRMITGEEQKEQKTVAMELEAKAAG